MADTRCANPEYQVDVDIMMLEYSIYQAIASLIEFTKAALRTVTVIRYASGDDDDDDDDDDDGDREMDLSAVDDGDNNHESTKGGLSAQRVEVMALVQNVEILLGLFKQQHSITALGSGALYNLKVLEFLVLFNQWLPDCSLLSFTQQDFGLPGSRAESRQRITRFIINSAMRLQWTISRRNVEGMTKEELIKDRGLIDGSEADKTCWLLAEILPHYLELSSEISGALGEVNRPWMLLTARFMVHAALERLNRTCEGYDALSRATSVHIYQVPLLRTIVDESFAWGYVNKPHAASSAIILEAAKSYFGDQTITPTMLKRLETDLVDSIQACDAINVMFSVAKTDTATNGELSDEREEHPAWSEIRQNHLSALMNLAVFEHIADFRSSTDLYLDTQECDKLQNTFPIKQFLVDLLAFIEGIWQINMDSDMNGKPVLIQIEEGGLQGLSSNEFKHFLGRCGLKLDFISNASGETAPIVKWER